MCEIKLTGPSSKRRGAVLGKRSAGRVSRRDGESGTKKDVKSAVRTGIRMEVPRGVPLQVRYLKLGRRRWWGILEGTKPESVRRTATCACPPATRQRCAVCLRPDGLRGLSPLRRLLRCTNTLPYSAVMVLVYSSSVCTSTGTLSGPLLARCRRSCSRLVLASIEVLFWLPSKFRSKVPQTLFPATSRHLASSFSAACLSQHSAYTGPQEPAV